MFLLLDREVTDEINVSHFETEHSSDGLNFVGIGETKATNSQNYSLTHTSPVSGWAQLLSPQNHRF